MPGYSRHLRTGVEAGGRPGVPPLRNAIRRRVREAAPYIRSLFETCPIIRLALGQTPSPWGGRLRTAARAVPTANLGAVSFFVGAGHWSARRGSSAIPEPTLIRLASLGTFPLEGGRLCGRGKSLSPLSRCARHLPLIRGVVPSPTGFKDTFRVWAGESLGPIHGNRAAQCAAPTANLGAVSFFVGPDTGRPAGGANPYLLCLAALDISP